MPIGPQGIETEATARLLDVYCGPPRRYLNYYGPSRHLETYSYEDVLNGRGALDVRGKIVFVGVSETYSELRGDSFHTVFTDRDTGAELSGVEIMATAFANLVDGSTLRIPGIPIFLFTLAALAIIAAYFCARWSVRYAGLALCALGIGYIGLTYALFVMAWRWQPWVVPVFVELPAAWVTALLWRYRGSYTQRKRLEHALSLYLPRERVREISHARTLLSTQSESHYGICLATDAVRYTEFSETLSPDALRAVMNRYFQVLFQQVRLGAGRVIDVQGDAMLAVWADPQYQDTAPSAACKVALDILAALAASPLPAGPGLATRIGIHAGHFELGSVGDADHYQFRAVGDSVNAATRIQSLNRYLGTHCLISENVRASTQGYAVRDMGRFLLLGKRQALTLYELQGITTTASPERHTLFGTALSAYQDGRWQHALQLCKECLEQDTHDGPARFYLQRCLGHLAGQLKYTPEGVVEMQVK